MRLIFPREIDSQGSPSTFPGGEFARSRRRVFQEQEESLPGAGGEFARSRRRVCQEQEESLPGAGGEFARSRRIVCQEQEVFATGGNSSNKRTETSSRV